MKTSITIKPAASPSPQHCGANHACAKRLGAAAASTDQDHAAFTGVLDQAVLTGALNQLMRYTLTGCSRSAMCAVYLLERLAASGGTSVEMRAMCCQVCATLEDETKHKEVSHG